MFLKIKDLKIKAGNKEILKGINLDFEEGKNYLILGKNGSGKSSLANFLMGNPNYIYEKGEVSISKDGKKINLLNLSPDERAKLGLFMSFQSIPEIEGIKLSEFLRVIYNISLKNKNSESKDISPFIFRRFIKPYLDDLGIPDSFLDRDLNVGFSGGEKKKIEVLQIKLIKPKIVILDEIDSGLDVDAFKVIAKNIKKLSEEGISFIVITHHFKIIDYLNFVNVYVMKDGIIKEQGGIELLEKIKRNGFE